MDTRQPSPELRRLHERDVVQGMVPQTFLRVLAEHLQRHGVAPASLMPPDALQPGQHHLGRHPAEAYCQLLLRAAERLNDPLLGLHLGQSIQPSHLGALGYVLLACENLGAALLRIQRYHRLLHDINPIQHHIEGDSMVLQWGVARGKPGALFDETGLTAIVQFARALCGRKLAVQAVDFVNPPPSQTAPFVEHFGCPVRWGQAVTRLVIPLASLQTPLHQPDPVLRGLMEAQVDAALAHLPDTGDLLDLTRRVVRQLARHGVPELEQVAAELRLSPRAFYRRLAERGCQFRQLRDDALRELAEAHLGDPRLTLADVSELLGYTEQSAFSRAFKRWSGTSPLKWRQDHGARVKPPPDGSARCSESPSPRSAPGR
ncbi:MAG: AraC family transcriptional regulator [Burkholderiales bacterium]|nr:AraC family transcriptional regulator [Burkholderiales bacterium]MBH2016056.1 AraC family transcriptional regulator [Burkholderiales bacterium]